MKRLNIALVSDTLFAGIAAFLLFFTAVRYYTRNAAIALAFGIAAFFLFGALGYVYISGKLNKKLLSSRNERQKKLLSLHLSLSSDDYIKNLLKKMLGDDARICGKKITLNGTANFFDFKMQPLGEDDIARVIKYRFGGKKKIYCTGVSPQAEELARNFTIEIACIDEVYKELESKNLLPEKYVYEGAPVRGMTQRIRERFKRKLAAPLFWSGAALMGLSYFTFFPLYYIISGSVLLILSLAALFFGQS